MQLIALLFVRYQLVRYQRPHSQWNAICARKGVG
jgi:hypothetical protein